MTGKEALDDYKDFGKIKGESITSNHTTPSTYHNKWRQKYFEEIEDVNLRADMVCARNDELENKLSKYERSFEILKDVVIISNLDGTYLLSVWGNKLMPEPVCYLEKEQGKLLEELMNNE